LVDVLVALLVLSVTGVLMFVADLARLFVACCYSVVGMLFMFPVIALLVG
jgi:hypothetical protein